MGEAGARWQIARPALSTRYLLDAARIRGRTDAQTLAGTGLRAADLTDPDAVVLPEQELRVIRNLLAGGDDPGELGIEIGLRYSLTSTGILGYALLSSPTVREAISVLHRYLALLDAFFDITFTDTAAGILVDVADGDVPPDIRPFLLTRDLIAGFRIASLLLAPEAPGAAATLNHPIRIQLRDPAVPDYLARAQQLLAPFGLSVTLEFDSPRNAFTIPRELLDQPTPAPDPTTAALCLAQCEHLLDQRIRHTGTAAQVRHLLLRTPAAMPQLPQIAATLNISTRTLHRRLTADHTTFRTLRDHIRETLATQLLSEGLTVESVARHLGYSDTAAFSHAYHRWTGHPPSRRP